MFSTFFIVLSFASLLHGIAGFQGSRSIDDELKWANICIVYCCIGFLFYYDSTNQDMRFIMTLMTLYFQQLSRLMLLLMVGKKNRWRRLKRDL